MTQVTAEQDELPGDDQLTRWLEKHRIPAPVEWRTEGTNPFHSPFSVGPIGYGRPRPTYDLLEETDLLVFVGTVPGDVITVGFLCHQNWTKKNFSSPSILRSNTAVPTVTKENKS